MARQMGGDTNCMLSRFRLLYKCECKDVEFEITILIALSEKSNQQHWDAANDGMVKHQVKHAYKTIESNSMTGKLILMTKRV